MKNIDQKDLLISLSLILIIAVIIVVRDENKLGKIKHDFTNPIFIGFFLLIVLLSIYGLRSKNKRIRDTALHASIAFIVSYLSHLDMIFVAFFVVGSFYYFTYNNDI